MFNNIKSSLNSLSNRLRRQSGTMKEKWTADFSKPESSCFDIKQEISFNAYLEKGSLFLGLKKKNCMARLETAGRVYVDQVINARFRLDTLGNHCASGIMFRVAEKGTYYLALVSGKGCFRFDAVRNGISKPLIGWTEAPGLGENGVHLTVIARGDHMIFIINGRWIAEARDNSIHGGHLGFPLVSYDPEQAKDTPQPGTAETDPYSCQARLDFLSVNSHTGAVKSEYEKWNNGAEITAESRLRLAESLAALDRTDAAYDQILKAWKRREETARSVSATYTEMRAKGELLLAARLAERLGLFSVAEEYIDTCLAMGTDAKGDGSTFGGAEMTEALAEKAKILSSLNKFGDLAAFLPAYISRIKDSCPAENLSALYALLGYARWNLKEYAPAAEAWDTAFNLNQNSGLYAANAANAYELLGRNETALQRLLDAGNIFLRQKDFTELDVLIPKLTAIGGKNPDARLLAGKFAFETGDFDRAEAELILYEESRLAVQPVPEADPAASYILGEIQNRREKPSEVPVYSDTPITEEIPVETPVPEKTEETPAETVAGVPVEPAESAEFVVNTPVEPVETAESAANTQAEVTEKEESAIKTVETTETAVKTAAKKPVTKKAKTGTPSISKKETTEKTPVKKPAEKTKIKPKTTAVPGKTKAADAAASAPAPVTGTKTEKKIKGTPTEKNKAEKNKVSANKKPSAVKTKAKSGAAVKKPVKK